MLCKDVMYEIEKEYPLNYALSWDNVGLLVGRDDKEVKRIYIALDATDEVIDDPRGASFSLVRAEDRSDGRRCQN